jgi:hypothetical protein
MTSLTVALIAVASFWLCLTRIREDAGSAPSASLDDVRDESL